MLGLNNDFIEKHDHAQRYPLKTARGFFLLEFA
jgi:hypothetical protein